MCTTRQSPRHTSLGVPALSDDAGAMSGMVPELDEDGGEMVAHAKLVEELV